MRIKFYYFLSKYNDILKIVLVMISIAMLLLFFSSCDLVHNNHKQDSPTIGPIGGMPSPYIDVFVSADGKNLFSIPQSISMYQKMDSQYKYR